MSAERTALTSNSWAARRPGGAGGRGRAQPRIDLLRWDLESDPVSPDTDKVSGAPWVGKEFRTLWCWDAWLLGSFATLIMAVVVRAFYPSIPWFGSATSHGGTPTGGYGFAHPGQPYLAGSNSNNYNNNNNYNSHSSNGNSSRQLSDLASATVTVEESLVLVFGTLLMLVFLSPTKVVCNAESFTINFPLHSIDIPGSQVLELMMVGHPGHFLDLLWRWGVFPFGLSFRPFWGMVSLRGSGCALLAAPGYRNVYFVLEDPINFLVQIQRPLDLSARYRTTDKALVREGESLQSKRIRTVREDQTLRVLRQSGRRCEVEFESLKVRGWMSHINQLGYFLLTKDLDAGNCAVGTVGASDLATRTYGATIELPTLEAPGIGTE
mmetsp:Transcript_89086/g.186148  ORF Transcript_89086/g.186148 Transcript_89086/m.186148 type:complete len:380 (+) Transcript_89086:377-1516(+)